MACGDQTWDPQLEDKMVRWTSGWAEKEIDKAAQRLGGDKQFKKKKPKKPPSEAARPGCHVSKGSAARIDGPAAAPAAEKRRNLPGLAAAGPDG